jgi:hypothetical protein
MTMDPDACLRALLDAFRDGNRMASYRHLEDLLDWVAKGGFLPEDPRINFAREAALCAAEHLRVSAKALLASASTYQRMAARVEDTPTEGS